MAVGTLLQRQSEGAGRREHRQGVGHLVPACDLQVHLDLRIRLPTAVHPEVTAPFEVGVDVTGPQGIVGSAVGGWASGDAVPDR